MHVIVVCESEGIAGLDLIHKARSLCPQARISVLSEGRSACTEVYGAYGASDVVSIDWCEDDCTQARRIALALEKLNPDMVLFQATVRGRFLSAWAAAKLKTGLTADCTDLKMTEDGILTQIRPAFGGSLTAEITCRLHRPQMASVRPGIFAMPQNPQHDLTIPQIHLDLPELPPMLRRTGFQPTENCSGLQNAQIVVAGGKGIGSPKGFQKLDKLAMLLKGAVGASRSAVDAGWISYAHQIGQTGIVVQPRLYIAVGIHGSMQHIVGMRGSGTVIAINQDRNAPIFRYSDYGIVGDWEESVDIIMNQIQMEGFSFQKEEAESPGFCKSPM